MHKSLLTIFLLFVTVLSGIGQSLTVKSLELDAMDLTAAHQQVDDRNGVPCALLKGQRFEVENVEAALFDVSASHNLRTDLNGDACALVKFEIASPNAKFQGNVVGEVRYDVGEYWVYVVSGTKELHVLHESLLPLKLYFPDYGIPELAAKTTYVVTLILPNTQVAPVTTSNKTRYVYPFRDEATGYWGLRNYMGEEIVEPRYEEMEYIKRHDYFVVVENGKVGIINGMGHELLPCIYDRPIDNCPDFVAAAKDGLWGVVDYSNKTLVPFEYQEIKSLSCGDDILLAFQKDDKWALVSPDGFRPLTPYKYSMMIDLSVLSSNGIVTYWNTESYSLIAVLENGKWGFINEQGKEAIAPIYDHDDVYGAGDCPNFIDGYAAVKLNGKHGLIDMQGKTVLPFEYWYFEERVSDHPAIYYHASKDAGDGSRGPDELLSTKGEKLIDKEYYTFSEICDSMVVVWDGEYGNIKYGVYDLKTKKEIFLGRYEEVSNLAQSRFMVKKDGKWGCFDRNGKQIFDFKYDEVDAFSNGAAKVKLGDEWGFVKLDGSVLVTPKYNSVYPFGKDRLAVVCNGGCECINFLGKTVTSQIYSDIDYYPEDYNGFYCRKVRIYGKVKDRWGYINYRGQEIVPCEYSKDETKRLLDIYLREHGHITD